MKTFELAGPDDFEGWRDAARRAAGMGLGPGEVTFTLPGACPDLFAGAAGVADGTDGTDNRAGAPLSVPRDFISLARQVACHSDPDRFSLLYRLLLRLQDDRTLLERSVDKDIHLARRMAGEVRRDAHKMKAFVRFRKTGQTGDTEHYAAWFEPTHNIVRYVAPFFAKRFATMCWSILTPRRCVHWDGAVLAFTEGVARASGPDADPLEDWWKSYYASIFNPARLKIDAMTSEMPKKYWKNMPETQLIPDLVRAARERQSAMIEAEPTLPKPAMMAHRAAPGIAAAPDPREATTIAQLGEALRACETCALARTATQAVPGRGPADARIMIVGEQPGDREDLQGEPFVGPAGRLLREVLDEIGEDIDEAYVTNAVKHFKFEPRGKRRIHKSPSSAEIDHCRWWLAREIDMVAPEVVVALGASAAYALTGAKAPLGSMRGQVHSLDAGMGMVVTYHPSYILRLPAGRQTGDAREKLSADLRLAYQAVASGEGRAA